MNTLKIFLKFQTLAFHHSYEYYDTFFSGFKIYHRHDYKLNSILNSNLFAYLVYGWCDSCIIVSDKLFVQFHQWYFSSCQPRESFWEFNNVKIVIHLIRFYRSNNSTHTFYIFINCCCIEVKINCLLGAGIYRESHWVSEN